MIETWLGEGEEVRIEKRGEAAAILKGISSEPKTVVVLPDFAARRRAIWGTRVFSESEVASMPRDELVAEQG